MAAKMKSSANVVDTMGAAGSYGIWIGGATIALEVLLTVTTKA